MSWPPERKSRPFQDGSVQLGGEQSPNTANPHAEQENQAIRCSNCANFESYGDCYGECRAEPPKHFQDGLESGAWPRVSASEWCGHFRMRGGV